MNLNRDAIKQEFIEVTAENILYYDRILTKLNDFVLDPTPLFPDPTYNAFTGEEYQINTPLTYEERSALTSKLNTIKTNILFLNEDTIKRTNDMFEFQKRAGQQAYRDKIIKRMNIIDNDIHILLDMIIQLRNKYILPYIQSTDDFLSK